MKQIQFRTAFTMIELLFVIVILGIVGGIALETVRQYYENIFRSQEYSKRVSDADRILDIVSKYFENAISASIVNLDRGGAANNCYGPPVDEDNNDYTIAFVGVDMDSFRGISGNRPGWSEDTVLGANNTLIALDANYSMADTIINAFGSSLSGSAIFDADSANIGSCDRFRLNGSSTTPRDDGYHRIVMPTSTSLQLNTENNATDGKRKYLLRTGYAFRVISNPGQPDDGNFMMYSNFRPWNNERYDTHGTAQLLGENVAHFYADYDATDFQSNAGVSDRGLVWRLKVCMRGLDANLSDSDAETQTICRERRVHVRY